MNHEQTLAARKIERALNHAGKVGLSGGVYDSKFRVYPTKDFDKVHAIDGEFFDQIEDVGMTLDHKHMALDGGAGV